MKEKKNAYKILVRKPEGKRTIERLTHTWEDIRVGLKDKDEREGNILMWFRDKQGVLWAW
jgi:hypothetical protein